MWRFKPQQCDIGKEDMTISVDAILNREIVVEESND